MPKVAAAAQVGEWLYTAAVNFFGHAVVARWVRNDPHWILGTMLPDFVSMCRARIEHVSDPDLAAGVAFHHRTDEAFHGCHTFRALERGGIHALEGAGVGRGAARAVAHVGTELLIDGLLIEDGQACADYLSAVNVPGELGIDFRHGADRFAELRSRVAEHGLPTGYGSPSGVTTRLRRILERRPRLALVEHEEEAVTSWLGDTRAKLEAELATLLEEVRERLGEVDTSARERAILGQRERCVFGT